MAQIFHRSFNVVSKVSIFGALFIIAFLGWVIAKTVRSPYLTNVRVAVEQPVAFSHEHHVGFLKIDCRFCHQTVETSAFAGMPATKTCMNCHSQIWVGGEMLAPVRESYRTGKPIQWNRVHRLPDFTHFDHSIHVQKGIGCSSCHGRVDQMPLVWQEQALHMDWCVDCHRDPSRHVRPREEIFNMAWTPPPDQAERGKRLLQQYQIESLTHCSTCHY
jgi:hypothetical protein